MQFPSRVELVTVARRNLARRPEYWLYLVALGAGLSLALPIVFPGQGGAGPIHRHGLLASTGSAASSWDLRSSPTEWRDWNVMVLAVMLPIAAPYARRIAFRSLWRRRQRAITYFLLGYLAVWAAIGVPLSSILVSLDHSQRWSVAVLALLGAAGWQVSPLRRRVLRRCGALPPSAICGWRADRDCVVTGVRLGLRCAFSCGPVMLAMAVSHNLILMGALLTLLLSERARGPNPDLRVGRELEAWCLVVCAAAVAAVPLA